MSGVFLVVLYFDYWSGLLFNPDWLIPACVDSQLASVTPFLSAFWVLGFRRPLCLPGFYVGAGDLSDLSFHYLLSPLPSPTPQFPSSSLLPVLPLLFFFL